MDREAEGLASMENIFEPDRLTNEELAKSLLSVAILFERGDKAGVTDVECIRVAAARLMPVKCEHYGETPGDCKNPHIFLSRLDGNEVLPFRWIGYKPI